MSDEKVKHKAGYLTLTRRKGDTIRIGKDIEIIVSKIGEEQIQLSIKAPGEKILRGEIVDNKPREKSE